MDKPLKGFITYSHKDTIQKDKLRERLAVMEQNNELVTWDDGQLTPGDGALQEDIIKKVADSDLLLYLVSAASLASRNCNKELAEALNQKIRVIPIVLEHCDWLNHRLKGFETLPHKGKPICEWEDESRSWQNVVDGVREAVEKIKSQAEPSPEISGKTLQTELEFQRGNVQLLLGQVDAAIEFYGRSLELHRYNANTYNNRGVAYAIKGDLDQAIKDYSAAIELKPNNAFLYCNRGVAYYSKGNLDSAIEDYNIAIKLLPNNTNAFYARGIAYTNIGDLDSAFEDIGKAIQLKPDWAEAYVQRGIAYGRKGDSNRAVSDFTKAIELNPIFADAYFNRSSGHIAKGDLDSAVEDLSKAIQLKPDWAEAYIKRGIIYSNKDNFGKAIEDFSKAIELDPDDVDTREKLNTVKHIKSVVDSAIQAINEALELNPNDGNAYWCRGELWLHTQAWEEAKADLTVARNMGMDIVALFKNNNGSVADFEQNRDIQLPEDIAAMLAPQ